MLPEWMVQFMDSERAHAREQLMRALNLSKEQRDQLERDTILYELPCDPTVH